MAKDEKLFDRMTEDEKKKFSQLMHLAFNSFGDHAQLGKDLTDLGWIKHVNSKSDEESSFYYKDDVIAKAARSRGATEERISNGMKEMKDILDSFGFGPEFVPNVKEPNDYHLNPMAFP